MPSRSNSSIKPNRPDSNRLPHLIPPWKPGMVRSNQSPPLFSNFKAEHQMIWPVQSPKSALSCGILTRTSHHMENPQYLPYITSNLLSQNCSAAYGPNFSRPPPDLVDREEEQEIKRILDYQFFRRNRKLQYLIKWKGFPNSDNE